MTPTQHILSTIVLLTLSSCTNSQPESKDIPTDTAPVVDDNPVEEAVESTQTESATQNIQEPKVAQETVVTVQTKTNPPQKKKKKTNPSKKKKKKTNTAEELLRNLEDGPSDPYGGGIAISSGESSTRHSGSYCINVGEGAPCPTAAEMDKQMPRVRMCSPHKFVKITSEATRRDRRIFYVPHPPPNPPEAGDACCYQAEYVKIPRGCVHGRPFMQNGEAKRAQTSNSNDWNKDTRIYGQYSDEDRQEAGSWYLQNALFEHASIASFHKFALELMQLGAPPTLLTKVQAAIQDEIIHSQMAFGIACGLLGVPVGPDRMSIHPQLAQNLKELAISTFTEGAIGESIAVVLAANQRVHTTEPLICEFLDQVIADESKHAELAWETLRWCLQKDPSIANALLYIDLDKVIEPFLHCESRSIPSLGILDERMHKRIVKQSLRDVVKPSLDALVLKYRRTDVKR